MRFLVTGGLGHVGFAVAKYIADRYGSDSVICIDNCSSSSPDVLGECNFEVILKDLSTLSQIPECDYVIHTSAFPYEGLSHFMRVHTYTNNLIATANLINLCVKFEVKRLVFTSSMAVYGNIKPPFDEKDFCCPVDPYGNAKLAAERDIQIASSFYGLSYCILRLHNVYGPGQNVWSRYRNVIGRWLLQCKNKTFITIYGSGYQKRAFSYIDDIVPCIVKACIEPKAENQIINLGGTTPYRLLDVAYLVNFLCDGVGLVCLEPRRNEVQEAYCTWQKSSDILEYKDKTSLKDGILATWNWINNTNYCIREAIPDFELDKDVYSYWR